MKKFNLMTEMQMHKTKGGHPLAIVMFGICIVGVISTIATLSSIVPQQKQS